MKFRCLTLMLMATVTSAEAYGWQVDAIAENVRGNEALYENIDVKLQESYTYFGDDEEADENYKSVATKESRVVSVRQDGLIHVEADGGEAWIGGGDTAVRKLHLFDGTKTRVLDEALNVANLISDRTPPDLFVRPHMLLLRPMGKIGRARLSTLLAGHEAMSADPDFDWNRTFTLNVTDDGADQWEGRECRKVSITTSIRGKPNDRWELWLDTERNYVPVRMLGFTFGFSKTLPVSEGAVTELKEVAEGVWFPSEAEITTYDPEVLMSEGKHDPIWRQLYFVEEVSVTPSYLHTSRFFQ